MTKSEMAGTVLLMAAGGRPSTDMSITPDDVQMMLPIAVNMAVDMGDNMNREMDRMERDYLNQFYGTYTVAVNNDGARPYFMMSDRTIPLKGNNGLRLVYDGCENYYGRLRESDRPSIKYIEKLTPCMYWYYRVGQKVTLYGTNPMLENVTYEALTDVRDIGDDEDLPLVAGTESKAVEYLYGLVTGQISNPYDSVVDGEGLNNAQKQ